MPQTQGLALKLGIIEYCTKYYGNKFLSDAAPRARNVVRIRAVISSIPGFASGSGLSPWVSNPGSGKTQGANPGGICPGRGELSPLPGFTGFVSSVVVEEIKRRKEGGKKGDYRSCRGSEWKKVS
jgi:hypothetical protein